MKAHIETCFIILLVVISLASSHNRLTISNNNDDTGIYKRIRYTLQRNSNIHTLRGGAIGTNLNFNINNPLAPANSNPNNESPTTSLLISTAYGSSFLDKKKKIVMNSNDTVLDLKVQLSSKFPGSPPVQLQSLYYGSRLLGDAERVNNITSLNPVPLMLDMMSGTSVYNKTMSVTQAIEAYVSTVVQQSYLGSELQKLYIDETDNNDSIVDGRNDTETIKMQTVYYRRLFQQLNNSIYERYADDIAAALEEERDPETIGDDTKAWRGRDPAKATQYVNPLTAAIAKEFDLNWRGLTHFVYYSIVLVIFAYFGTTTASSTKVLLCMIPAMWLSKIRQLRLLKKIVTYLILPVLPYMDFLMPLLPAPLQVIAEDSVNWDGELATAASKWMRKQKAREKKMHKADLKARFNEVVDGNTEGSNEDNSVEDSDEEDTIDLDEESLEDEEGYSEDEYAEENDSDDID